MSITNIKRQLRTSTPEKGLHDLPGAQKMDHHGELYQTIRVKGQYITNDYDQAGRVIGIGAYILAWSANVLLLSNLILSIIPFTQDIAVGELTLYFYPLLGFLIHMLMMLADGMRNSNAPWARKSIIVFWGGLALFVAVCVPVGIIMSFL